MMKILLSVIFVFIAGFTKAQTLPVKWATQETFFEDLIGKDLPAFKGITITGNQFSKQDLKNKIVLINFWFKECPPCVKEIPELNKFVDKYKRDNVRFIAITYDERKRAAKFQKKIGYKYEIICLTKDEIRKLNINHGFPSNILVGKDGKIIKAISSISFSDEIPSVKEKTVAFEQKLNSEISHR
ncbi:MAG: TlpA family protein disulfide reductase [Pedobacter sp.]|nr:MAG: TlpA family protein disulfide reductase [Pedobacter sp.]